MARALELKCDGVPILVTGHTINNIFVVATAVVIDVVFVEFF